MDYEPDTWRNVNGHELDRLHLVTLAAGDGQAGRPRSALRVGHETILAALDLPEPCRIFDFTVPGSR